MKKLNTQQGLALFYIAFGLWVAYVTRDIRSLFQVSSVDVGPKMFPYCCAAGLILCGIGKFISSRNAESKPFLNKQGWLRFAVIFLVMAAYIAGLTYLGYIITTPIMLFGLTYMLADGKKLVWWQVLLFAVIMTAAVYFAFTKLMNVMLPAGEWTRALLRSL